VSSRSLPAQILLVNALLLLAVVAATAAIGVAQTRQEALLLAAGILSTVLVNGLVLRRRFAPLERLIDVMERVDGATRGEVRAVEQAADSREVRRLTASFNAMLERVETERARTSSAVLRGQEAERARLARDLHDECNQALTGILLRLEAMGHTAPEPLRAGLTETKEVTARAMDELLRLARELRPTVLDDVGLEAALRSLVAGSGELVVTTDLDALGPDEQVVVYRVVQEALSNARRHADARHVRVVVGTECGEVVVRVVDDGRGFEPAAAQGGLGLTGMRERARLAGGRVDVRSTPAAGTTVELRLCAS
jgi:two-component system sensor histidine kinase UhpB